MKQEKRISYQAGITRRPSDFLCKDGDLAECINLTTDTEELKPVVQPEKAMEGSAKILFVHRFNNAVRYICIDSGEIKWHDGTGQLTLHSFDVAMTVSETNMKVIVKAIGKTLIIADDNGLHYALWQSSTYKKLGDTLPEPDFTFWLYGSKGVVDVTSHFIVDSHQDNTSFVDGTDIVDQEKWNDLIVGFYNKNLKSIQREKGFCRPFFIRTALRLFDGSYTNISQPILMFPSLTTNSYAVQKRDILHFYTKYSNLYFRQNKNLTDWNDIIKGVTVFVSDGIEVCDLSADQTYIQYDSIQDHLCYDGIFVTVEAPLTSKYQSMTYDEAYHGGGMTPPGSGFTGYIMEVMAKRKKEDIEHDITSTSIFYKLCDLGLKLYPSTNIGKFVPSHVLMNITSQSRLDSDDYFSRSALYPKFLYTYNSRLHLANVNRGFFEGFHDFMPLTIPEETYTFTVYIKTDDGVVTVTHTHKSTDKQGYWFFYPDPRATYVEISVGGSIIFHNDLTEHPALNGAYYFDGLPTVTPSTPALSRGLGEDEPPENPGLLPDQPVEGEEGGGDNGGGGAGTGGNGTGGGTGASSGTMPDDPTSGGTQPSGAVPATKEYLSNYLLVSEVFNPWVYRSKGYYRIGQGTIIGMATQSVSLAQEEHGIHQLIVFTDRCLVSLLVGNDGQYTGRVDEMPREVCINPASITETDGAVFFVSKKGLMVIVGNQASCVSENLNGHPFDIADLPGLDAVSLADQTLATAPWAEIISACQGTHADHTTVNGFLEFIRSEKCRIVYDYIDSRLLIINPDFDFAYVYNIKDSSISKVVLPEKVDNVVNDYPDNIMQQTVADTGVTPSGNVYSLYDKPREDEVDNLQTAFLLTRPMKLGGPLTVSSLRELVNVGFWDKEVVQALMPANNETEANEAPAPGTETETPEENEAETPISSETEGAEETSEDAEEPGVTPEETPTEISCVKSMVWVSDNLKKWYLMSSRFGAAAKYFRLGLFIKMLPTERLSGTIITEQERRTNNLRR